MFFKDIADYKKYVSVNSSMDFDNLSIYLNNVDRTVLKRFLGQAFFAELQTAYNASIATSPTPITGKTATVVELIRQASAIYALAKWVPFGQLNIDDAGIRIANTEHFKTAFQWQINDLVKSLNDAGTSVFDELLIYLETNVSDFTTYKNSDEFKSNTYLFISNSTAFSARYSAFINSPSQFYKLKSIIEKVEDFSIKPVLLPDLFTELKTQISAANLTNENKELLAVIRPAVAHLTVARAINELAAELNPEGFLVFDNTGGRDTINNKKQADKELVRIQESAQRDGETYLKLLGEYLEDNKSNYPTFTSDTKYVDPTATTTETTTTTKNYYSAL